MTQALKSHCEAELMEDTNRYKCGSEKCKGKEQNAYKSLCFQVGFYCNKFGMGMIFGMGMLFSALFLPALRMSTDSRRWIPIYVSYYSIHIILLTERCQRR